MRVFIAIKISDTILRGVRPILQKLRDVGAHVKWVKPENMHLTLKFLGDIDPTIVPQVADCAREAVGSVQPFEIDICGIGTFPQGRPPRVVWLGTDDPSGSLSLISDRLDKLLVKVGVPSDNRAFRPHLTLGRIRSRRKTDELVNCIDSLSATRLGTQCVDEIILFESQLTRTGPVYTRVSTQQLG